ncbi:hypothetical protein JOF56_001375 [Kibdelosporangium banguiense]|uniref:Uncharacterized protein n=1 Tax=Kibdelosporangium banguiense TaxID=1365924 RepID=A0ABS4TA60_9PSEU|nr:hypothetical protein [Kibdelosporangium banguiense]MBP2320990.1 hypothetical protein [Kibdelosporangium banguiense]
MKWTHRLAALGGATAIALTTLTTAASAQATEPSFDVQKVCDQRIPKLETRANKMLTRITGDAKVVGSTANLRARAERAKAAGNEAQADWLNGKADHREQRVGLLRDALAKLDAYKQKHCGK